ncbi:MAG: SLC13 family permease [Chitinophagales bacterium]
MFIVLTITVLAIILFATEIIPADVTALCVMVALMLTGIVSPEEGLAGFSNVATITVFALLVLSLGLQSTGVVNYMGEQLERITGESDIKILLLTLILVAFLSAFMNNTAIVAIFLPIVMRLSKYANTSASKFLMPLSFAAMIGGSCTIIGTSTNILVSAVYEEKYGKAFSIFEFTTLGFILFLAFLVYILLIGWRIIPERRKDAPILTEDYDVNKYLTQIEVRRDSSMIGKPLKDTELVKRYKVKVLEITREEGDVWLPEQVEAIRENDLLLIKANLDDLLELQEGKDIKIKKTTKFDNAELTSEDAVLFEAVIGQNSFLVGKAIKDVDFRKAFGAIPLALRRSGISVSKSISDVEIQFGDVLLLEARRTHLNNFYNSRDFIVLEKVKKKNLRHSKMLLSTVIVLVVILLAAFNVLPIVVSSLTGVVLLLVTECVSIRYIYRKMDWRVIFLLAGILPLGTAVQNTGASELISDGILYLAGDASSPRFIISILFLITTVLTSFMSNNATAVLLAPIAITIAQQLGLDPKAFLVTVMFAASTSFATPIGYQTNTLVYGVGQYTFMDFIKVGGFLTIIVWLLATWLIPIFYL